MPHLLLNARRVIHVGEPAVVLRERLGGKALEQDDNGADLEVSGVLVLQRARRGPRVGDILAAADLEERRLGLDDRGVERGQHSPVAGGEE